METQAPTATRILIAAGFAISCFALALFLWLAFGGAIPLNPKGYQVRLSFGEAARPEHATPLYERFCTMLEERGLTVARGRFGADMHVEIHNDGPVTIWLDSAELPPGS